MTYRLTIYHPGIRKKKEVFENVGAFLRPDGTAYYKQDGKMMDELVDAREVEVVIGTDASGNEKVWEMERSE